MNDVRCKWMKVRLSKAEKQAREEFRRHWDMETASRPGPKAAQTARSIAKAAIIIADEEGLTALSMRNIAAKLSMSTMALYNHFPGKSELLSVMVDEIAGEALSSTSGDWRERTTALAYSNWQCFLRHPWLPSVENYRPVIGPNVLRKYDQELAVFDGLGLTDIEMDFALSSLLALVKGCAMTAIDANGVLKQQTETDGEWWGARQPLLAELNVQDRFPLASRVGEAVGQHANAPQSPEEAFRFGLDRWIAGMQALVAGRV